MSNTVSTHRSKTECAKRDSVLLDTMFVPVLVVMIQAAYAANGNGFRNAFLSGILHPVILISMAAVWVVSFLVMRPFARRNVARKVVFLFCVAVFTVIAILLTPAIAE